MSIENADRLLRFMDRDSRLREKVRTAGVDGFEDVAAQAGASCTAYDVVCAIARRGPAASAPPTSKSD